VTRVLILVANSFWSFDNNFGTTGAPQLR
jgi:hypothetical protein